MSDNLDGLLGALMGAPHLPGARCVGRHQLFDPPGDHEPPERVTERHTAATHLCRNCPALASCEQWVDSLPRTRRPPGVTGGVYRDHPSDAKRRRKRNAA